MLINQQSIDFVTDIKFYGIWQNEPGLIIGSGATGLYQDSFNPDLDRFQGRLIGCSDSCKFYKNLDLIIWIDDIWDQSFWDVLNDYKCLKFSIACDPPTDQKQMKEDQIKWLKASLPPRFSLSFRQGFYPADSTGYLAFNVALLMGCNPLYLYGFDSNKHPYFPKAKYYEMALEWLKEHNRKVYITEKDSYLCTYFEYKQLPLSVKEGLNNGVD